MPRSSRSLERGIAASASASEVLPAGFYRRSAGVVARELLGVVIESQVDDVFCRAEIVETEAYTGPADEASHAHERFGVTSRNAVMFGPPAHAYLYRIYGIHWCLNAVTGPRGFPAAVLIRAARPLEGLEAMRARRPERADRQLLRGPGNLARALGLDGRLNAHPLTRPPLRFLRGVAVPEADVHVGPRIGVTRAADLPLRFWVKGSPWVSARRSPGA